MKAMTGLEEHVLLTHAILRERGLGREGADDHPAVIDSLLAGERKRASCGARR